MRVALDVGNLNDHFGSETDVHAPECGMRKSHVNGHLRMSVYGQKQTSNLVINYETS